MSRAVFMSAGGDPFIALFAYKLFKERWYDEVDKFYICYNNNCGVPQEVVDEFLLYLKDDPKVEILYFDKGIGNGKPIEMMLHASKETYVMLMEDDGFIFTPGVVDRCFKRLESGEVDVLGSPRFSCGFEVSELLKHKYNLSYHPKFPYEDIGPNFWPNFFFCQAGHLRGTDLNFGSYSFEVGKHYKELGGTITQEGQFGDTFVWACIQLRFQGLKFGSIPQKHASPTEFDDKLNSHANWVSPIEWIHGGSLSTSWGGYLTGAKPNFTTELGRWEIETRCAFWTICVDEVQGFEKFKSDYCLGLGRLVGNSELSTDRIELKIQIYRDLMKI